MRKSSVLVHCSDGRHCRGASGMRRNPSRLPRATLPRPALAPSPCCRPRTLTRRFPHLLRRRWSQRFPAFRSVLVTLSFGFRDSDLFIPPPTALSAILSVAALVMTKALATAEDPYPLPSLAPLKGHIRHIIIHDFVALREQRRQVRHAQRIRRPFFTRIQRRIDI